MNTYQLIKQTTENKQNIYYTLALNKGQTNGYFEPDNIKLESDPLNFQIFGSPAGTAENNQICLSSFSTDNYLLTPQSIDLNKVDTFEIVIAYKGNEGSILQQNSATPYTVCISYASILVHLEGDSGWTTLCSNLSNDSTTKYWMKLTYNGSAYIASRSTDGINYTEVGRLTSTKKIISNLQPFVIGTNDYHNDPFQGTIYPADSYIKINGQMWWKGGSGAITLKTGSKLYFPNGSTGNLNCNINNNVTINDGIAGNFSMHNYLTPKNTVNLNGGDTWEVVMAAKGSSGSIIGISDVSIRDILIITPTKFVINGDTVAVINDSDENTKYWYKLTFTGNEYIAGRSTDGENFTQLGSLSSTSKLYSGYNIYFGFKPYGSADDAFNGEIDIARSYIKIDGETVWQGGIGKLNFNEVVTTADSSIALYTTGTTTTQLSINQDGTLTTMNYCKTMFAMSGGNIASGVYYYNPDNNTFYLGGNTGLYSSVPISFPFAKITYSNGSITINEIYNGVGYMGSTIFVLPGTKFLAADGGSSIYNNIEFEVTKLLTCSFREVSTSELHVFIDSKNNLYNIGKFYNQSETPEISTNSMNFWYNPYTNIMMKTEKYSSVFTPVNIVRVFKGNAVNIIGGLAGFYNGTEKINDLIERASAKYLLKTGSDN